MIAGGYFDCYLFEFLLVFGDIYVFFNGGAAGSGGGNGKSLCFVFLLNKVV